MYRIILQKDLQETSTRQPSNRLLSHLGESLADETPNVSLLRGQNPMANSTLRELLDIL